MISRLLDAETRLAADLGLSDAMMIDPLVYTATAASVRAAGRIDAQYFAPRFRHLIRHIEQTGQAVRFGDILATNIRGSQPSYAEEGLPVVNSKHIRRNRVEFDDMRFADPAQASVLIEQGDLLLNGTGVGTIGRASAYLRADKAIPDNHVTVLRAQGSDPVYLSVYLNSRLGQMQVEQHLKGSSGQIELYPSDIAGFVIWRAPEEIQESIRQAVVDAFAAERRASDYLEAAKLAVEIAIEQDEAAAMHFLDEAGG